MSVKPKRGSRFLWYDFYVAGKRHRGSTEQTTIQKAKQVETLLIQKAMAGKLTTIHNKAPYLRDYAVTFLDFVAKTRLSDKTKEYYRNGWRLLEKEDISGMRIDAIKRSTTQILSIPGSGSTVNCALRTLRRMLSLAVENELIIKRPRITMVEEVERKRLVEAVEESLILAKAPRTLRDAYLLVADLGIRPDDAVSIQWDNVDFSRNDILIMGGKTGIKAKRYISMTTRVREMMLERAKLTVGCIWAFPSRKGKRAGKSMTAHSISSRFSNFKKKEGLSDDLVLYSARHTFATDLTEATGNLSKTQKALGHTALSTTARYNHSRSADIAAIMNERNSSRHTFGHSSQMVQ